MPAGLRVGKLVKGVITVADGEIVRRVVALGGCVGVRVCCVTKVVQNRYEKVYFLAKRLPLVIIKRPKGMTHFYLSIGPFKKG